MSVLVLLGIHFPGSIAEKRVVRWGGKLGDGKELALYRKYRACSGMPSLLEVCGELSRKKVWKTGESPDPRGTQGEALSFYLIESG